MSLKIYQVDAFTDRVFSGNPAAIVPLDQWLDDGVLQQIAMENNLAETAFYVRSKNGFEIRWFTPAVEVDLCGHATLGAAHVLFNHENISGDTISFHSPRSGLLSVVKRGEILTLNFPADHMVRVPVSEDVIAGFSAKPGEVYKGKTDYMLIYKDQSEIEDMIPDFAAIGKVSSCRGVIVTAPGNDCDFVSRFFAPQSGINEDPVTGSAHTSLAPYWATRFGRPALTARQLSPRGGYLECELSGNRVLISGKAKTFMVGEIMI
jgi:PhzF family phenazine biosynthesis protein